MIHIYLISVGNFCICPSGPRMSSCVCARSPNNCVSRKLSALKQQSVLLVHVTSGLIQKGPSSIIQYTVFCCGNLTFEQDSLVSVDGSPQGSGAGSRVQCAQTRRLVSGGSWGRLAGPGGVQGHGHQQAALTGIAARGRLVHVEDVGKTR